MRRLSRAQRNNTPLNISLSKSAWRGQVIGAEKRDAQFCQFEAPCWGWRLAFKGPIA